jgi:hypothetical protein
MTYKPEWGSSRVEREERARYAKKGKRSHSIPKERDLEEEAFQKRSGHNDWKWDPEAPVTGAPYYKRDIQPFKMGDGTEISSRSSLRDYQRAHQVEQVGLEWTGEAKPHWWDAHQDHTKDKRRLAKKGIAVPDFKVTKPQRKQEKIAVTSRGVVDAKSVRSLKNV